jgi:hypothetical protein
VLQADFLSLGGTAFNKRADKASPLLVAVLASNAQTMSTFVSTQKLMMGLLGEKYTQVDVAKAVVDAAYRTFTTVDPTSAAKTLTKQTHLVSLYSATYQALTGTSAVVPSTANTGSNTTNTGSNATNTSSNATSSGSNATNTGSNATGTGSAGRRLLQSSSLTPEQLQNVFGAVASTVSSTNTQVQQLVDTATAVAADPTSTVDTSALMVDVSKMATVQQQSLASDISSLATSFAANPSTTPITALQAVSAADLAAPSAGF